MMSSSKFDSDMRRYETINDTYVLPNMYIVARLDGRGFSKLTKNMKKPYDNEFKHYMVETTKYLMYCGFDVVFACTHSDEISLLFRKNIDIFNRKERKFNSVLAGAASAKFTKISNEIGVFDCRLSKFPTEEYVVDYFRWRQQDALRNCLNSICYYFLLKEKKSSSLATNMLLNRDRAWKNDFLFENGINFNKVRLWKKRGVGMYFKPYVRIGKNPITNKEVGVTRNKLIIDESLPTGAGYDKLIKNICKRN